jgi:hypothetical protein
MLSGQIIIFYLVTSIVFDVHSDSSSNLFHLKVLLRFDNDGNISYTIDLVFYLLINLVALNYQ